jgi:hypothetical protein
MNRSDRAAPVGGQAGASGRSLAGVSVSYSGTPLATKLGIGPGNLVVVRDAPDGFADLLEPLPGGVRLVGSTRRSPNVVITFVLSRARLAAQIERLGRQVFPAATLWVAWPKKASSISTDVTEDVVREVALPLGLVDTKVCAIDATWSGLKLVWRRDRRG